MPKPKEPVRFTFTFFALLASVSAATVDPHWLFERQDVCGGNSELAKCEQSDLPANFCCQKTESCIVLAGNTTVLCCPEGNSCTTISPIVCEVSQQNPDKFPKAAIKTTALDSELEKCGSACCPFGYSCMDDLCVQNEDQSSPPDGAETVPTSTRTSEPSATSTKTTGSTTIETTLPTSTSSDGNVGVTPAPSLDDPETSDSSGTPVGGIIGGVVASVLAAVAVIAAVVIIRRRKKGDKPDNHDTSSSFGNIVVSAPRPIDEYPNMRQDFLAKANTESIASSTVSRSPAGSPLTPGQVQPYSNRSSGVSHTDARTHHPSAEIRGLRSLTHDPFVSPPQTPLDRRMNSGGSESINVYVESPSTVGSNRGGLGVPRQRDTAYTTWSNILDRAGRMPESPTPRRN